MKALRWPWETKRLGEHHWVTRPWHPHRDPRVQLAAWLALTAAAVVVAWQMQADAGISGHAAAVAPTMVLMLWTWRGLHGRLKP